MMMPLPAGRRCRHVQLSHSFLPPSLPSSTDAIDRGRVLSWRMRRALSRDGRMRHHQVGHILGGGWWFEPF